ncbi:MAG TPA: hypothetical protein VF552_00390 [Allosphingosinicella sp.]|jgi:hypothetical protein
MAREIGRALAAAALMLAAGCTATGSARDAGVSYNRAFADARNEVLLLNILRTAAREPMQFSTINQVTGAPRPGAQITIPFSNILLGGDESINPTVGLTARNPSITIIPLSSREFMRGMAAPIDFALADHLIAQGWHPEIVLGLAVGGVVCSADPERVRLNTGVHLDQAEAFRTVLANSRDFSIAPGQRSVVATLRMNASELAQLFSRGVGEGRQIGPVRQSEADRAADRYEIDILRQEPSRVLGLNFNPVCPELDSAASRQGVQVLPRSPQSMIFYLAALHQAQAEPCGVEPRPAQVAFRIRVACPGQRAPATAAISTEFHGRRYFVDRAELAGEDDTLRILSLLTELIALQTTEAALGASRPILTIPQ